MKDRVKEILEGEDDQDLLCKMSEMWGAYIGEPVQRQSLRFAWMESVCGGGMFPRPYEKCFLTVRLEEEMFIETNYKAILEEIAKTALEKADIRLNTKVIGVKTTEREVLGSKVELTTESGEKWCFDEVIMTTPLGWLKRYKHIFEPPLPPRLLAGIDGISVGHLEKVCRALPSPFHLVNEPKRFISRSPPPSG